MKAALKLFVEFGFHGTPTSKIAQAAGVANGTLFHYFKTKDELITSLYAHLKTDLACFSGACVAAENAGLKEIYRCHYVNALTWALKNAEGFRFIMQFTTSPFLSLIAPEEIARQTAPILALFQQGIDNGIFTQTSPEFLYSIVTSHVYGMNEYLLKAGLTPEKNATLIAESFEMLWKMII